MNDRHIDELRLVVYYMLKQDTRKFLDYLDEVWDNSKDIEKIKKYGRKMFMEQQLNILNICVTYMQTGKIVTPYEISHSEKHLNANAIKD